MDRLEALLERTIKRQGEDSPVVQMLRDQISAEKRGAFTDHDRQLWVNRDKASKNKSIGKVNPAGPSSAIR